MLRYMPQRIFFEPRALEYPLGRQLYQTLQTMKIEIHQTPSHNRVSGIPGRTVQERFREAKKTLVVGVKKISPFSPCKPSAHYQLPLTTSCPGMCEYCYLATTLGKKPYLRVYVNIDEILEQAQAYIQERCPEITVFEGAATSDPIPTEYLTGLLYKTIEFFGKQNAGRFRFVTKHDDVDSLLSAQHNGHTRFRFSLNAAAIINNYEHATATMEERIAAAAKVAAAGYPLGFIIAPLFYFPGWQEEYGRMFRSLERFLPQPGRSGVSFEFISHRFTRKAKNNIMEIFPESKLPMEEENRKFKYGQFGYGKFIYEKEFLEEMNIFMKEQVESYFPEAHINYFI
ncbi:radical sam alpha/beta horseshoe [Lucifera butyrica]|uniref:Radical sam alpha/beta horseshoe n=1 Tax=Lucifera butyrica TaxID=1351585 RepID=A0A498R4S5_9FIRM|nr:spore photoproduct lyase [Lucifera butyrica]VBB05810.1 radical sam alpha/beta horseshoe [Lucifera butyrica]